MPWRARSLPPRSAEASSASLGFERVGPTSDWKRYLGRKVSLRYRLGAETDGSFSEAIGVVQSVGPDDEGSITLSVLNRKGMSRDVRVDDIVAAKVFPL